MIQIVLSGRNDSHGGESFAAKLVRILEWNSRALDRAGVPHRFWFVEWGREPGQEWLSPGLAERFPSCRCVMVPDELVRAGQQPPVRFQEFAAKNVGIARALDGLVIATNSDILFSAALARFLKELSPQDGRLYRAPRHDFSNQAPFPETEEDIVWTQKNEPGERFTNASGDFTAATPATWALLGGYSESPCHVRHLDSELIAGALFLGMDIIVTPPVFHRDHPESTKFSAKWRPRWGEEDEALSLGKKLMPRASSWGHRHCGSQLVSDRAALLLPPEPKAVSSTLPDPAPDPVQAVLGADTRSGREWIQRAGQMLALDETCALDEFEAAAAWLKKGLAAPECFAWFLSQPGQGPRAARVVLSLAIENELRRGDGSRLPALVELRELIVQTDPEAPGVADPAPLSVFSAAAPGVMLSGGAPGLRVTGLRQRWAYAARASLAQAGATHGPWRAAVAVKLLSGRMSFGVLNRKETAFIGAEIPIPASGNTETIRFLVRDAAAAGSLILRTWDDESEVPEALISTLALSPLEPPVKSLARRLALEHKDAATWQARLFETCRSLATLVQKPAGTADDGTPAALPVLALRRVLAGMARADGNATMAETLANLSESLFGVIHKAQQAQCAQSQLPAWGGQAAYACDSGPATDL